MAWFLRAMFTRPRKRVPEPPPMPTLEECRDDSARARLADDIDEGSFTMEEDEASGEGIADRERKKSLTCFMRLKKILRSIYKVVSSVVGLLVLLVIYSFIGAAIFRAIEGPPEKANKESIIASRQEVVDVLLELSANLSQGIISQDDWNKTATKLLEGYEGAVHEASKNGVTNSTSDPKWTFWGSMFFCGTIYTTIGYGHIAPSTGWGRIMTMVYAAIGIPLALVCLADLGKHFTLGLKLVWAFCRRYCNCCKKVKAKRSDGYNLNDAEAADKATVVAKPGERVYYGYKIDDEFNIPIYVAIGILVLYIFLGSIMYAIWEEWAYLESFYFVFISISTIGFGDVLPAHPKFFLLSSVYVFIGLSLVSMCVNVAIEFFSKTIDKAKVNIDKAKTKAKEKAKEAKEKMHEVSRTIDRAKDRAKERVSDLAHSKRRAFREGSSHRSSSGTPRQTPSSDDIRSESETTCSPVLETHETNSIATT